MQFVDTLPPKKSRLGTRDWNEIKQELMSNPGMWGLMAEDVAASTIDQLRAGVYKDFRGDELEQFEFATRTPQNQTTPYKSRRTDLWGRYTDA